MAKIISTESGITLSNAKGVKLEVYEKDGKYGLGTFYLNDVPAGACSESFLYEDAYYVYEQYQADRYEIEENTEEEGRITFFGTIGVNNIESNWLATISLRNDDYAFKMNMQVEPYLWPGRYHELYVTAPFENDGLECITYPMEASILPPFKGHYSVQPDVAKLPFLLGREHVGDKKIFVGLGYTLDYEGQDYTNGRLWYDTIHEGRCLRIDFPYKHYWIPAQHSWDEGMGSPETDYERPKVAREDSIYAPNGIAKKFFRHGKPYICDMVISIAPTQSECVFAYRDLCGYSNENEKRYDVMDATREIFDGMSSNAPYVYEKGMGYRQRGWSDTDDKANYYDFIFFQCNNQLAVVLYDQWTKDNSKTWARERAIEMVDFYVKCQTPFGPAPRSWDADNNCPHGVGNDFAKLGMVYCTNGTSLCAMYIDKLCDMISEQEGMDAVPKGWREAAQKAIDWLVAVVEKDKDRIGSTYNDKMEGVLCGCWPGIPEGLRYFYNKTGDEKYGHALKLVEDYIYYNFGINNDWYNGSLDCNSFHDPATGPEYKNYDMVTIFEYAGYLYDRYEDTKDETYLQQAKDMFAFGWMSRMPINMPGYKHLTKGIVEEQAIWTFYDLPWIFASPLGFVKIFKTLDEKFYPEYFKAILQTQLDFAQLGKKHPFFAQIYGAGQDFRGPIDRFGEQVGNQVGVWITGYTSIYLEDLYSKDMMFYLGSKGWGMGMDYDLDFNPDFGDKPYIRWCSVRIKDAKWEGDTFRAVLNGWERKGCVITFKWEENLSYKAAANGNDVQGRYDAEKKELTFTFDKPIEDIVFSMSLEG